MKKRFLIVILVAMLLSACGSFKSVKNDSKDSNITEVTENSNDKNYLVEKNTEADKNEGAEKTESESTESNEPKIDKDDYSINEARPGLYNIEVQGEQKTLNCFYLSEFVFVSLDEFANAVKDTELKFDYNIDEDNRTVSFESGKNYSSDSVFFNHKFTEDFVDVKVMPFFFVSNEEKDKSILIKYNDQFFVRLGDIDFVNRSASNIGSLSKTDDKDVLDSDLDVNASQEEIDSFLKNNKAGLMIKEIAGDSESKSYSFELDPSSYYIFDSSDPKIKNSFKQFYVSLDQAGRQQLIDEQNNFIEKYPDAEIFFGTFQRNIFFVKKDYFKNLNRFPTEFFLDCISAYFPEVDKKAIFDINGAGAYLANKDKYYSENKLVKDNFFFVTISTVDFESNSAVAFPEGQNYDELYKDTYGMFIDRGMLIELIKNFDQPQEDRIYILVVFI